MEATGPQDAPAGYVRAQLDAAGVPEQPLAALVQAGYSAHKLPNGTEVLDCGKYIVTVGEYQVWWREADLKRWRELVKQAER